MVHFQPVFLCEEDIPRYNQERLTLYGKKTLSFQFLKMSDFLVCVVSGHVIRSFFSHWQEHGYLIIYVTSRPDFQKNQVMLWMSEHNFPFGLVSFCGSLSTVDIQRHKVEYLRNLTTNVSYDY